MLVFIGCKLLVVFLSKLVSAKSFLLTSHSSGPADAGRLTPALYKTQRSKHETQDRMISGLVSIRFRGLFFEVVISVGFLGQVKLVVTSFCLFLLGSCISRWVSDFV